MNIALQAPSSVRRSKKRLAAYDTLHTQLRREVSRRNAIHNAHVIINGMDELWDGCLDNLKADPDYLAELAK